MNYRRPAIIALLTLAVAALVLAPSPRGASGITAGYPDSMASLGDSITQAVNPEPFLLGNQPQYSWSTGDNSAVESHYYRILQQNSLIGGNNYNDAVSGARMTDLNGQTQSAVSQGVEYVTILMGANDVCTSSEATMTTVETYRSQFQQAMDTLTSGLPDARIFVASIPDIYDLWFILKDNPSAVFMWNTFNICQSLLENPTSTAQADAERRDRVRQRNIDFNTQLAEVCALYTNCLFDNKTGFNAQFEPIHISSLDYFHPSIAGQTLAARVSWDATYFGDPDGDGVLNLLDGDDDNDELPDSTEVACGSNPLSAASLPERVGNDEDDDGDGSSDETQAPVSGVDCDCDGYEDDIEAALTWPPMVDTAEANCANMSDDDGDGVVNDGCPGAVGHQSRCADTIGGTNGNDEDDDQWPPDFNDDGRLNLLDVNSFVLPVRHYLESPLTDHARWDLEPGGTTINLVDVNNLNTLAPPMLDFARAFAGTCPAD